VQHADVKGVADNTSCAEHQSDPGHGDWIAHVVWSSVWIPG
jgi:hypothetical protein